MSILYRIDKQHGITFVVWDGVIRANDFLTHVNQLLADADWPPYEHLQLSDLQTATLDPTFDESALQKAANLFGQHPAISNLKVAIVTQTEFKSATDFERLIVKYLPSVIVFNDLETACLWLGIDIAIALHVLNSLRDKSAQ
jgi:hypothetical protein